ncbi:MAG: dihydroneopterin aldolase [Actinomycetota bacterium]
MPELADCVQIRGLRIVTYCGVLQQEQDQRQPFRFDIDIYTDLRRAGATDELDHTVNYGAVTDELVERLHEERFLLVERMAQRASDLIMANELVDEVTVTVAKLRPPIAADVDTTGVRIHRRRADAT